MKMRTTDQMYQGKIAMASGGIGPRFTATATNGAVLRIKALPESKMHLVGHWCDIYCSNGAVAGKSANAEALEAEYQERAYGAAMD